MSQNILILGASGRFGRHAKNVVEQRHHIVRTFDRRHDNLADAVAWSDIVINGWNPPYPRWSRDIMPMTHCLINCLQGTEKRLILAGNVYGYGSDAPQPWGPDTPHRASNPMGKLRIEMEQAYRKANISTIILRSGDFLDTQASGNWFDMMIAPSLAKGILTYPAKTGAKHSWAYLPDVGRIVADLVDIRATLPRFCDLPFAGFTLTPNDWQSALTLHFGQLVRIKPLNWMPLILAYPVWPMARRLIEMRYLWSLPHALDPKPLETLLPNFKMTPLADAIPNLAPISGMPKP
jgi:hypothetical protein